MAKIADILADKGTGVHTISPDQTVFDAIYKMVETNVGALLVVETGGIEGIFTERDYLRRIALEGRTSKTTVVEEVMSSPVIVINPDTDIEEGMAIMSGKKIRHLPVVDDDGTLVGIVSIGDLVKHQSKAQKYQIQYLTDYIAAR